MSKLKPIKPPPNRSHIITRIHVQASTSTTRSVEDTTTINPTYFVQKFLGNTQHILFVSPSRGTLKLEKLSNHNQDQIERIEQRTEVNLSLADTLPLGHSSLVSVSIQNTPEQPVDLEIPTDQPFD